MQYIPRRNCFIVADCNRSIKDMNPNILGLKRANSVQHTTSPLRTARELCAPHMLLGGTKSNTQVVTLKELSRHPRKQHLCM